MTATSTITFEVPRATKARWVRHARASGRKLVEFLSDAAEREVRFVKHDIFYQTLHEKLKKLESK